MWRGRRHPRARPLPSVALPPAHLLCHLFCISFRRDSVDGTARCHTSSFFSFFFCLFPYSLAFLSLLLLLFHLFFPSIGNIPTSTKEVVTRCRKNKLSRAVPSFRKRKKKGEIDRPLNSGDARLFFRDFDGLKKKKNTTDDGKKFLLVAIFYKTMLDWLHCMHGRSN